MGGETTTIGEIEQMARELSAREVAETDDPILRNYLITQSYWELANSVTELIDGRDLVWPTFGSWASAQAGRHMRMESPAIARLAPPAVKQRIITALGRGNRRVFSDIAPPFERFVDFAQTADAHRLADADHRGPDELSDRLRDQLQLDPRPLTEHDDGQRLMIMAFTQYFLAIHEDDPDARAERVYVANCCVGLQEQMRIDCMLDHLLDVDSANDLAPWLLWPLAFGWWATGPIRWFAKVAGETGVDPLESLAGTVRHTEREVRIWEACLLKKQFSQVLGTSLFMNLRLDDGPLDINEDVPPFSEDRAFPPKLAEFDTCSPQFRAHLDEVLRWDDRPDTPKGSAAHNWSDLDDRMNYIVDLFRTRQQDTSLTRNPLSTETG